MKTPAPQRAAGRKKLAAQGQALGDGSFPIPTVDYLKKAIRSVGRAPASKRPALAALIRTRAKALGATSAPGVKGTWAFQAANDGAAVELVGPHGYIHGWIKVGAEPGSDQTSSIEWLKSGKTNWAARSNAYTIERGGDGQHIVRDGHGRQVGEPASTLQAAKTAAQRHQDRGVVGGAADEHIAKAKLADAEGRHADAINHLGAAINATTDKSAAFHLTELKKEMAARAMGVPYKAKPLPKRLHAMANDGGDMAAIELVGPKGYEHGWIKVGPGSTDVHTVDVGAFENSQVKSSFSSAKTLASAGHYAAAADHLTTAARHAKETNTQRQLLAARNALLIRAQKTATTKRFSVQREAIEMATATPRRMPVIRGAADVQLSRTGPGQITAMHKSTGMKVGMITPSGKGYAGKHADGTATPASGGQQGALAGLIAYHNAQAAKAKAGAAAARAKTYTAPETDAVDLAGALPVSTPAASASDGPRVTSMGSGKTSAAPAGSPSGLSPYAAAIYKKFIAKGMKPAVALAFAKRADAMHAKAAGPKASAA